MTEQERTIVALKEENERLKRMLNAVSPATTPIPLDDVPRQIILAELRGAQKALVIEDRKLAFESALNTLQRTIDNVVTAARWITNTEKMAAELNGVDEILLARFGAVRRTYQVLGGDIEAETPELASLVDALSKTVMTLTNGRIKTNEAARQIETAFHQFRPDYEVLRNRIGRQVDPARPYIAEQMGKRMHSYNDNADGRIACACSILRDIRKTDVEKRAEGMNEAETALALYLEPYLRRGELLTFLRGVKRDHSSVWK